MHANAGAGLLLVLLLPVPATSDLCLASGIANESRAFIQDEHGEDLAIGLFVYHRSSSTVMSHIAGILISEKLGYHVEFEYLNRSSDTSAGQYWLSCQDVNQSARGTSQCIPGENRVHVALDT
ncbi:unnamed protein product, partial [Symbiodinium microadriaticum]